MEANEYFEGNRLCKLLGIHYPVIQGGMVWCAGSSLAAAVSESGGLGLLGSGSMELEELRSEIAAVRAKTDNPFGVNIPLQSPRAEGLVEECIEGKVPVVVTSAGSPSKYTERLHAAGITVGHVVAGVRFARKCEEAGVDFLVAEGFEAGGHNSPDELSTLVLAQLVAGATRLPFASAGGYHDGRGMAAALMLGADGVQLGSRFACTEESKAHENAKRFYLRCGELGTRIAGRPKGPIRLMPNAYAEELLAMEARGASPEELRVFRAGSRTKLGIREGDVEQGEMEIGQVAALFETLPKASEVVREVAEGCLARIQELSRGL